MPNFQRLLRTALTLLALWTFCAAAAQETVTITHAEGETTVPKNPERVVVIGEEILELAWVLDMNVVGLAPGRVLPENVTPEGKIDPRFLQTAFLPRAGSVT